jgi:hypothetical protein
MGWGIKFTNIHQPMLKLKAHSGDRLFHWQHKLCATFSTNVDINYRLPIKVYYRKFVLLDISESK